MRQATVHPDEIVLEISMTSGGELKLAATMAATNQACEVKEIDVGRTFWASAMDVEQHPPPPPLGFPLTPQSSRQPVGHGGRASDTSANMRMRAPPSPSSVPSPGQESGGDDSVVVLDEGPGAQRRRMNDGSAQTMAPQLTAMRQGNVNSFSVRTK
jgi:hypothetical protein